MKIDSHLKYLNVLFLGNHSYEQSIISKKTNRMEKQSNKTASPKLIHHSKQPNSNSPLKDGAAQFKDQRPEAIAQRRIQSFADNSVQVRQLMLMQQLADQRGTQSTDADRQNNTPVTQHKLIIGNAAYTKRGAKTTKLLKEALKAYFGAAKWKRGWIKRLGDIVVSDTLYKFKTPADFASYLMQLYPPKVTSSPEADLLKSAFAEAGSLSITGFIWKVVEGGFTLSDGRSFTKTDLLKALHTKEGRALVDAAWRDKSGGKRVGQKIQGQHEWILTSDIRYVIANAKGMDDLATWFMAAEMLRTPTKNVIFNPLLSKKQIKAVKSGKIDTFADLGALSAHAGGLFVERMDKDPKKKSAKKHNVQTAKGSTTFHTDLHQLLTKYLNEKKSDLPGFLKELMLFQQEKVWSGKIKGIKSKHVKGVETGFYTGAHKSSPEVSKDMRKFMELQQERNKIDLKIMENRVNAIMSEVQRLQSARENWVYKLNALDDDIRVDLMAGWEDLDEKFEIQAKRMDAKYNQMKTKVKNQTELKGLTYVFQKNVAETREKTNQIKMKMLDNVYKKLMGT